MRRRSVLFCAAPPNIYQARAVNRQKNFITEIFRFRLAAAGSVVGRAAQPLAVSSLRQAPFSLFDASAGLRYLWEMT
jgi:hypothetical protein